MLRLKRVFENRCFESEKDKEDLKKHLGDDLYNDYIKIKNKIPKDQNDYKDFQKLKKLPIEDVQAFVDNFQSETDRRKEAKKGAKKLYEDDDWVVYKITTYPAAKYYGSGTKWCITGRYPGHEGRGEGYFNDYIKNHNLDGGYYFYITKDGSGEKYCVLQTKDKKIHSIWTEEDDDIGNSTNSLDDYDVILPQIPEVNIKRDSLADLIEAIDNNNEALVEKITGSIDLDINKSFHGTKPLYKAIQKGNTKIVDLLIKRGAKLDYSILDDVLKFEDDYNMLNHLFDKYIPIDNRVLMYAIRNYNAIKCILDSGYDPTRWRDSKGNDLLEYSTGRIHELLEPYFN